jgi:predicted Zn finger-like uncharacterized protein
MIEIQCTSCNTRYRIDERVLPDDTPTFKCSRCGHVFSAEVAPPRTRPRSIEGKTPAAKKPAAPTPQPEPVPNVEFSEDQVAAEPQHDEPADESSEPFAAAPDSPSDTFTDDRADAPDTNEEVAHSIPEFELSPPSTDLPHNPLDKSFDSQPSGDTGDNLRFDFPAETAVEDPVNARFDAAQEDSVWQTGDSPTMQLERAYRDEPIAAAIAAAPPAAPPRPDEPGMRADRGFDQPFIDQIDHMIDDPRAVHGSGWFICAFFTVAATFFAASVAICAQPALAMRALAGSPVSKTYFEPVMLPATIVVLSEVRTEFRQLKGGRNALVITGNARNMGAHELGVIAIAADLIDRRQRPIMHRRIYCGNRLPEGMMAQMTPRELEFSLGLDPPRSFALDTGSTSPFMIVFVEPPAEGESIRLTVSEARALAAPIAKPRG